MKIKKLVQVMIVSCGILSLAACSSMHKSSSDNADMADVNGGGAQSSGLGDGSGTFGTDGMSPQQLLAKHVYYFDFDRSEVNDNEKPAIYANADRIMANPRTKVLLEGHTDPRGSREYNVALGERRANAVAEIMKSKGVNPDQIRVISYGAERLAVPGHNEEDFKQDRRAVLVYLQK
ncbi:MAG: OmpA family protein [Gammaproteobacteria bacterium]|nr:OmpA family protein [Gammaproteobacteria bacterium]